MSYATGFAIFATAYTAFLVLFYALARASIRADYIEQPSLRKEKDK